MKRLGTLLLAIYLILVGLFGLLDIHVPLLLQVWALVTGVVLLLHR